MDDRRLKVYDIMKAVGISDDKVLHILSKELGRSNLNTTL